MAITFTRTTTTIDPATDTPSSNTSTITGSAIQVNGNPQTYRALSLVESQAPTLLFTPTAYNLVAGSDDFVKPGDTVVWPLGGPTYTVKDVSPIAPDGVVIMGRIVVAR